MGSTYTGGQGDRGRIWCVPRRAVKMSQQHRADPAGGQNGRLAHVCLSVYRLPTPPPPPYPSPRAERSLLRVPIGPPPPLFRRAREKKTVLKALVKAKAGCVGGGEDGTVMSIAVKMFFSLPSFPPSSPLRLLSRHSWLHNHAAPPLSFLSSIPSPPPFPLPPPSLFMSHIFFSHSCWLTFLLILLSLSISFLFLF